MDESLTAGGGGDATVRLTADASQYERTLDRAAAASAAASKRIESRFQNMAARVNDSTRGVGMAMTRVLGVTGGGGPIGGVAAGLSAGPKGAMIALGAAATKALFDAATGADKFAGAIRASERQAADLAKTVERAAARSNEWLDAVGSGGRQGELDKQIAAATEQLNGFEAGVAKARDRVTELKSNWSGRAWGDWMQGELGKNIRVAEAGLVGLEQAAERTRDRLAELQDRRGRIADPMNDPKFVAQIARANEELEKQVATWGKNANEIRIYDLATQSAGKATAELAALQEKGRKADEATASAAFAKDADAFTAALDRQAATFGMTTEAVQLYDLKMRSFWSDAGDGLERATKALEQHGKVMAGKQLAKDITDAAKAFTAEADAIGKAGAELKIMELAARGANAAQVESLRGQAAWVDLLKKADEERMARISAASQGAGASRSVEAAIGGSREAVAAINAATAGGGANNPAQRTAVSAEKQVQLIQGLVSSAGTTNTLLQQLVHAAGTLRPADVVTIRK